jgi:hypothetical protein
MAEKPKSEILSRLGTFKERVYGIVVIGVRQKGSGRFFRQRAPEFLQIAPITF